MTEPEDVTRFLRDVGQGKRGADATLLEFLIGELRAIAFSQLKGQRVGTLQATALVNEAYLKLFERQSLDWKNRGHFFALGARAMRQVLVDDARRKRAAKRGGGREAVELEEGAFAFRTLDGMDADILDLHEALTKLSELDERQAKIIELRFFAGLEVTEVAEVLGVSLSTVEREWRFARAWLGTRLAGTEA